MKKVLALVALCLLWPNRPVFADASLALPVVGTLNLTNLISNAGPIDTYDNHGVNRAGVSVRGLWFPNDPTNAANPADQAWMALEGAIAWDTANGSPTGLGPWLGFRLDTLGAKILGTSGKIGHLPLPDLEFGPLGMYLPNNPANVRWVYGGAVALHFKTTAS